MSKDSKDKNKKRDKKEKPVIHSRIEAFEPPVSETPKFVLEGLRPLEVVKPLEEVKPVPPKRSKDASLPKASARPMLKLIHVLAPLKDLPGSLRLRGEALYNYALYKTAAEATIVDDALKLIEEAESCGFGPFAGIKEPLKSFVNLKDRSVP